MIKVLEKLRAVNNGGIEAFVFNSVQFIRSDKLDIHYYSDIPPAAEKYKQCVKNNGKTIDVPSRDYEKISFKPVRVWLKWFDFYKYCRKEQFDIVHIHMCRPYDVLYAAAVRFSGKSRIILHSHFSNRSDVKSLEKKFDRVFQRLSSKLGDSFCACSNSAAEYMFEKNSRYTIVKNGLDTARFGFDAYLRKITRDKLGVGDRLVIGHVARLCEIKNQLFLVDVFDCINRKAPESVLLIAGEGDYRKKIEKRISELGL